MQHVADSRLTWDAIVVGAGPAGSSTAAQLARGGYGVLLLDRRSFPRDKPCAEYASPETEHVLRRLGVWSQLEQRGIRRLRGMVIVSPSGRRFPTEYLDGAGPRHSLAVPRLELDDLLLRGAQNSGAAFAPGLLAEAPILEGGTVVGVRAHQADRTRVELRCRLLVVADGVRSRLASRLAHGRFDRWPRRLGLATHVRGFDGLGDWGEMYVGRNGYCGVAPLPGGMTTVAAVVPLTLVPSIRQAEGHTWNPRGPGWLRRLGLALADQPALLRRLAQSERTKPVRGVGPLAWRVARTAGPGFLLVGDAAGFFDPFTGEGIFRALRGAELAAQVADHGLRERDWETLAMRYHQLRLQTFRDKERLARLIQVFVRCPPLLDYALARLERRPELATRLSAALGDFAPAGAVVSIPNLARLLRP